VDDEREGLLVELVIGFPASRGDDTPLIALIGSERPYFRGQVADGGDRDEKSVQRRDEERRPWALARGNRRGFRQSRGGVEDRATRPSPQLTESRFRAPS
jgi:hypothetical protein